VERRHVLPGDNGFASGGAVLNEGGSGGASAATFGWTPDKASLNGEGLPTPAIKDDCHAHGSWLPRRAYSRGLTLSLSYGLGYASPPMAVHAC
jgi:hypothetical protein